MSKKRKKIAIIDYGMGNLHSVGKAVADAAPDWQVCISNNTNILAKADKLVFPGVGAIGDCVHGMRKLCLDEVVCNAHAKERWILAICVGFQALFTQAHEFGEHKALGIVGGDVKNFCTLASMQGVDMQQAGLRVPHSGWNQLCITQTFRQHQLFRDIPSNPWVYFVHSCAVAMKNQSFVAATATHGIDFIAMLVKDTIVACQFHPEKSHNVGQTLLRNFVAL